MLILPKSKEEQQHEMLKAGLRDSFNKELEKTLNKHSRVERYWILGKVRFPSQYDGKVGRVFMERSDVQPPFVQDSFVYYVDNRKGTKELLWMSWGDTLRIVPAQKTLRVQRAAASNTQAMGEAMQSITGVKQRVADERAQNRV